MAKTEGELLAQFLEFIDNEWLAMQGCEDRVKVRCLGPREDKPEHDASLDTSA